MKIYPRKLTQTLTKEVNSPRIVISTGMRQVGKTTLMRQIFNNIKSPHKIFLDLENPLNQKVFEEVNFDNIIPNLEQFGFSLGKKSFLFLDEVQVAPGIVKAIKYLYDHYQIKFFLTGSSSFYLKNLFPESLAGRKVIYELFPLDFEEFLIFKEEKKKPSDGFSIKAENKNRVSYELYKKYFSEYLEYGGFPAVVLEKDRTRKKQVLEDIFKSYFEKDVKSLADFRELGKLRDLILLLTNRISSKIEISKIASEIGVSRETVYSYLNFLEKTYFISLISPFSRNINGEVRGAKKVYFCDNGLLSYLGRVSEGTLFENAVFQNLKKYGGLNYYERYRGPEVDFILNKKTAFEIKIKGDPQDLKRLKRISEGLKIKECYLIVKDYSELPRTILAQDL
ncbi:MAG: ATP-binding protein [Acidobacteriota bacterium]